MSDEQDPMLGDEATQQAYIEQVKQKMLDAVEEVRAERRATPPKENEPVMLGNTGFTGGISSA